MRAEKVPEDVSWGLFFAFEKAFFRVSIQIFAITLREIIGVQSFSLSFCKSKSRITMCNLHWYYTWTALLSANQNRVIFSCVLLSKWINSYVPIYKIVYIQIAYITYYYQFSEGYLQKVIIEVTEKQNIYSVYIK